MYAGTSGTATKRQAARLPTKVPLSAICLGEVFDYERGGPGDIAAPYWHGNGSYRLVNRTNGMVADGWGATADGSPAQQAGWNGGTNQQWQITDRGNGQYSIANRTAGLVLDGGGQVASGSVTKQWTWNGSTNLQWSFTAQ